MSVEIKITDNYYLKSDSLQWIISKHNGLDKFGIIKWRNLSFHTTPKNAIESLSELLLRESGAANLKGLVKASKLISKATADAYHAALKAQNNITLTEEALNNG